MEGSFLFACTEYSVASSTLYIRLAFVIDGLSILNQSLYSIFALIIIFLFLYKILSGLTIQVVNINPRALPSSPSASPVFTGRA